FETTRRRKDGMLIPVSLTISPVVDGSGSIVGSSAIERDISNRLRREKELQTAKDAAAKANRTRGEFLANVSHELRTPMNAIIGMTEIALDEPLSKEARDYIATANEAAHSLLTILNDILDFSKLESGKFSITRETFSLTDLIDETTKTISAQAFDKGLELICDLPAELPRQVIGDAMRVRQVLTNLLVNAIKFIEQGEVVLRLQVVRQWPTEVRIRFAVIDTGIGIASENQSRVLEPFAQADASTTREHGGTGLGLAICSELLRMMGGKLSLTSELGRGSTFSFRLSFDLPEESDKDSIDGMPLDKLHELPVLVVDDNDTNCRFISETLKNWSMKPTVAGDADQAIGIYQQATASGQTFPLVIVDALMPGTDGYELSTKLANMAPDSQTPIILMVSSTDRREFREREDAANIAVFLQKPVTQSDLLEAVMRAFKLQPLETLTDSPRSESTGAIVSLSILLAEDVPANQKVVATILKKRGHTVKVADNGREAVELFKKQRFDVILMDVQMPILDGYQATAAIRELEKDLPHSTPIIAMTAHAMRGDREKCLEAGMDAYIAKPLDAKQLLDLIESITETRFAASNKQDAIVPIDPQPMSSASRTIIDYQGAMQRLGQDAELYREFIGFYDEDSKNLLREIEEAVSKNHAASLQHAAHSLKGLAGNLGATGVVDAAFELEKSGRSASLDKVSSQLATLRDEIARLDAALDEYRS
ncbi:MAG TPA: response regulator, partial [Pirellulaceae bacterium]|nr:response regulator [Pirellulaceae bacterium]